MQELSFLFPKQVMQKQAISNIWRSVWMQSKISEPGEDHQGDVEKALKHPASHRQFVYHCQLDLV